MSSHTDELQAIKDVLVKEKPGPASHIKMTTGDTARFNKYYKAADDAHQAAVMLLLMKKENSWHTLFMKRAQHNKDKHSGQISFPGGRYERSDMTMLNCALRETEEEVGIVREDITVLGELTPLYVFASNHLVQTYVGLIDSSVTFRPNDEVDELILGDIESIFSKGIEYRDINTNGVLLKDMPYYNLHGHVLWGATAMIFTEMMDLWQLKNF